MTFKLPQELANYFDVSLKTIYNYKKRYPKKIRTKQEFWKTFIHFEDLSKALQSGWIVKLQGSTSQNEKISKKVIGTVPETDWKVKDDYKEIVEQNLTLKKINSNLEDQVHKYAIIAQEEKSERKELLNKFERLQSAYNENIQRFSSEKINRSKRVYLLTSILVFLILVATRLILPQVISLRIVQK